MNLMVLEEWRLLLLLGGFGILLRDCLWRVIGVEMAIAPLDFLSLKDSENYNFL